MVVQRLLLFLPAQPPLALLLLLLVEGLMIWMLSWEVSVDLLLPLNNPLLAKRLQLLAVWTTSTH